MKFASIQTAMLASSNGDEDELSRDVESKNA